MCRDDVGDRHIEIASEAFSLLLKKTLYAFDSVPFCGDSPKIRDDGGNYAQCCNNRSNVAQMIKNETRQTIHFELSNS